MRELFEKKTYLSLTGGTGLPISKLMECPMKFKHIKDGWRLKKKPIYYLSGTLFHKMAETILKGEKDFSSVEKVETAVSEALDEGRLWNDRREEYEEYDVSDEKKVDTARKTVPHQIFQVYLEKASGRFDDILQIERKVEVDLLKNPQTGEPDDVCRMLEDAGIVFTGTIDLDKSQSVEDLKTASPSSTRVPTDEEQEIINSGGFLESNGMFNPKSDIQLQIYGYMKTIEDEEYCKEGVLHIFTKHKTMCRYIPVKAKLSVLNYIEVFNLVKQVGRDFIRFEEEGYPKCGFASGCKDMFGQPCIYRPLCFEDSNPELKDNLVNKKG